MHLKTQEQFEQHIDLMLQDIDLSKQNLSKHAVKNEYRKALDRIGGLERTIARLRQEMNSCSECGKREMEQVIGTYYRLLNT